MSYEDLFSQLNQLRSLYATNRKIQEDKHIQKLYEPVTVTYEIYHLAILATDTWEKITSGTKENTRSGAAEFAFDMKMLKSALDEYRREKGELKNV